MHVPFSVTVNTTASSLKDLLRNIHPRLDWIEQCFTSPPTQYRLYGRWFLQVKRPNQEYQSSEGTYNTQITKKQ